ncbi:HNH endonuclease [Sinorhizobium fredii]|uniref:HNH endonuclease n=1 Tax=Rhizobium fredii TaxID=380 RepID=UPI003511FBD5
MDRNVFAFRIRPGDVDRVREVLANGQIAVGWSKAKQLLDLGLNRNDFRRILHEIYHREEPDFRKSGQAVTHTWRFIRELKRGDIVLIPHDDEVYFVEIAEDRAIYRDIKLEDDTAIRRNVARLFDGNPLGLSTLSAALQEKLAFRGASKDLADFRDEILGFIDLSELSTDAAAAAIDDRANEVARDPQDALTQTRPEQALFRQQLRDIYGDRCCISGTTLGAVLQAAHVVPHCEGGRGINHHRNGMLLRSDIHLLFDALLLTVEPSTLEIRMAAAVKDNPDYRHLEGRRIETRADPALLAIHYDRFRERHSAYLRANVGNAEDDA